MGCRHYFVVDRLEDLVDEVGSRSSWRAHEHEIFQLVSQLNVAIQIFWSRCPPHWTLRTNRLVVLSQRVSPFYRDLHLHLNRRSCSHERNVHRFPDYSNGTCFQQQRVSHFNHDLDLGLAFCLSSNFWTQLLHPIMFHGNHWRRSMGRIYFFVYDFYSFHPNNFRDTTSWECFVKDDCVRSRLIELQSFLLSKFDIHPIHLLLMFLPCFMHVLCKTRCTQVVCVRILVFFVHRIHRQKEYCLSVAQILTSRYQSWIDDGM